MIVVIGAGISGLTCGNNLNREFIILEKENFIGGLSTQYESEGYWFDHGGHYFHFKDKLRIKKYLETFSIFKEYNRKSKVFVLNRMIPFPIQYHLSHLPSHLRKTIINEILKKKNGDIKNLNDFLEYHFGKKLFQLFFKPFLTKYYNRDLKHMVSQMDRGSIPLPRQKEIIEGSRGRRFSSVGYNPVFYYPQKSLRNFIKNYTLANKKRIQLNEGIVNIDIDKKKIKTRNSTFLYDYMINTMPLKNFLKIIEQKDRFPSHHHLQNISTLVSNVVLRGRLKRFHWVYLPEKKFPFYRVGFYPAQMAPVCYLEKTVNKKNPIKKDRLFEEITFTLKRLDLIKNKNDIIHFDPRLIPVSYIIFNRAWEKNVPAILNQLKNFGIYSIGRYGAWNYTSMSDDVQSAIKTSKLINKL